jgi:hypothetical protein
MNDLSLTLTCGSVPASSFIATIQDRFEVSIGFLYWHRSARHVQDFQAREKLMAGAKQQTAQTTSWSKTWKSVRSDLRCLAFTWVALVSIALVGTEMLIHGIHSQPLFDAIATCGLAFAVASALFVDLMMEIRHKGTWVIPAFSMFIFCGNAVFYIWAKCDENFIRLPYVEMMLISLICVTAIGSIRVKMELLRITKLKVQRVKRKRK